MGLIQPTPTVPLAELGRVHFIGIAGVGMSGVARVMTARGVPVSGSDIVASDELTALAAMGATVYLGHDTFHLDGVDTVVVSTAIRPANLELAEAQRRGLRIIHRASALASLMLERRAIAVAGTHGKTTTTSMITTVLRRAGAKPGYVIGGVLTETGICAGDGGGDLFVVEADESDGSFLMMTPELAVVTCVEADHLDNYGGLAEIEATFARFAEGIRPGGTLIACADDHGARALASGARARQARVRTYGTTPGADYQISDVTPAGMSVEFSLSVGGTAPAVRLRAGAPGHHNALNAAAAYAAARESGIVSEAIAEGLAVYQGARRRLERKGEAGGALVLDSYAHHPTELGADLRTAREIRPGGKVIVVFQPHLFSRTRMFAGELGGALAQADEIVVLDIYGAREDPEPGVTGRLVADAVPGRRARYVPDRKDVPGTVATLASPGDLVLTMGAGDVTALGPQIVEELRRRAGEHGG